MRGSFLSSIRRSRKESVGTWKRAGMKGPLAFISSSNWRRFSGLSSIIEGGGGSVCRMPPPPVELCPLLLMGVE